MSKHGEARIDMHCHSSASETSRLGVQRAVGLPECATPPEEVYALAKRRGMDFVTITDHDTIAGVMEIACRADVFVSEELTAHFRGEPQAVHVLCYGITPDDHEWLQAHSGDVERCASYLRQMEIACALAHPYYAVGAPLSARHRRRLAEMFDVWEVRNGGRARELNMPAATYIATLDGAGIGGSDDHAGVDIGRTWTATPPAGSVEELLAYVRAGEVSAGGGHGSAAKWAHAAIALAARTIGWDGGAAACMPPDPRAVLAMARRVMDEGDARHGRTGSDLRPHDAQALLRAWLAAVELDHLDSRGLLELMQQDDFSHASLFRRACRAHERKLRVAVEGAVSAATRRERLAPAALALFEGCLAVVPYAPAAAFIARERAKLDAARSELDHPRVAIMADGIGATHGVTRALQEIRNRGVRGFETELVGTDREVDRRLGAVAEVEMPFYSGLTIGVPSLTSTVQALTEGRFDAIHVCAPGPAGAAGALLARALGLPLVGSYHTELTAYAALRAGDGHLSDATAAAVGALYGACDVVLSPSASSDEALSALGVQGERVMRWERGVDASRFTPGLRRGAASRTAGGDAAMNVLYAGRTTKEKGSVLLADAFLAATERDPRLRLLVAGGGPDEEALRQRLGERARFLGWLDGEALAETYANADIFLFPSATDTFGQVILEAQASGLPVVAVAAGGPLSLIEDRVSGLLCPADPKALADAVLELAASPLLRRRLSAAGLSRARERTWERCMQQLAAGYERALGRGESTSGARAA